MKQSIKRLEDIFITQWNRLVEVMTKGSLLELLLKAQGIEVNHTIARTHIYDKQGKIKQEFGIIAVSKDELVVVEVKTSLKPGDVDYFLEKMQDFKKLCPEYTNWKVYGAVAYIRALLGADIYSEKKGLFVIRAVGKNAMMMNAKNFKPKELALNKT